MPPLSGDPRLHAAQECERRDVKGLYQRARRGEISNFTGIDDVYEPSAAPELRIDTSQMSVQEAADRVMAALDIDDCAVRVARVAS